MKLTNQPLYAKAEAVLRERIADGTWPPGMALPAEPTLAEELGVSQGTLRRALAELERANLILKVHGKGSVVAVHTTERALFHFFRLRRADGAKAQASSMLTAIRTEGAEIVVERLRLMDGQAVIRERITLPAERFRGFDLPLNRELEHEMYVHYQRAHGVTVAHAEESMAAEIADAETARVLRLPPGTPVLRIDRDAFDVAEQVVERRTSWLDTREYRYGISLA